MLHIETWQSNCPQTVLKPLLWLIADFQRYVKKEFTRSKGSWIFLHVKGDIHLLHTCNSVTSCEKALNDSGEAQEESGQCTGPQPRHKRIANNISMMRELDKREFRRMVDIMIDRYCSNLSSYVYQSKNEAEPGRTWGEILQDVQLRSSGGTTRAEMLLRIDV